MTFRCPECNEVYQAHWMGPVVGVCRTCTAQIRGQCEYEDHPAHLSRHPCGYGTEEPGDPCRYCGRPVPPNGNPCPHCWLLFKDLPLADIKAVFAADGTFNVSPEVAP